MFPRQQLISAFKWLVNYLWNRLTAGLPKSLYKPSNVTRGRADTFTYKRSHKQITPTMSLSTFVAPALKHLVLNDVKGRQKEERM